jgi:hypothetical protein
MLSLQLKRHREPPPAPLVPPGAARLPPSDATRYGGPAMRHATPQDLERIAPLLHDLRTLDGLTERTPGVFYRRSRAFLHFHGDPDGIFADVRLQGDEFERMPVSSRPAQAAFLRRVRRTLGESLTSG